MSELHLRRWAANDIDQLADLVEESGDALRVGWAARALDSIVEISDPAEARQRLKAALQPFLRIRTQGLETRDLLGYALLLDDRIAGSIDLWWTDRPGVLEVGCSIHAQYRRQGLASRSAAHLLDVAFERLQADAVEITTTDENQAAITLAVGLGFTDLGVVHQRLQMAATPPIAMDCRGFRLDRETWPAPRAPPARNAGRGRPRRPRHRHRDHRLLRCARSPLDRRWRSHRSSLRMK